MRWVEAYKNVDAGSLIAVLTPPLLLDVTGFSQRVVLDAAQKHALSDRGIE